MTKLTLKKHLPRGSIIALIDIDSTITNITTRTTDISEGIKGGRGWYICNGTTTTDLASNKELPDLIGASEGNESFLRGSTTQGNLITGIGGTNLHELTIDEMPSHLHDGIRIFPYNAGAWAYNRNSIHPTNTSQVNTNSAGSGTPHENQPPYKDVIWIIKLI